MVQVDLDVVPLLEAEGAGAFVGTEAEQRVGGDDVAAATLPPCNPLELTQLLERIDAHVGVGADAQADVALADSFHRKEAVAEVRLSRRARTEARSGLRDEIELRAVGMRGVHDGRALAEAARTGEQLDRTHAVLGDALVDLSGLLI